MSDVLFGDVESGSSGALDDLFEKRVRKRHPPRRPSIPVVLWIALSCCLGTWLSEMLCWSAFLSAWQVDFVILAFICFLIACALVLVSGRRTAIGQRVLISMAFLTLAFGVSLLFWNGWVEDTIRVEEAAGLKTIEVSGDAQEGKRGWWSSGRLVTADGHRLDITIAWEDESDIKPAGTIFSAYGSSRATPATASGRWNHRHGICGTVRVYSLRDVRTLSGPSGLLMAYRHRLCTKLATIDSEGSALMAGIVLGDQSRLRSTALYDAFRQCGLAHLIAVSGSHLMVVSAMVGWFLSRLSLRRGVRFVILESVLVVYLVLSGLQISALRALIMTSVGIASLFFSRRSDRLSACCVCVMVLVLLDPCVIFSFAFGLSVAAVLGIIIFYPLIRYWVSWPLRSAWRITDPVALTLSAQLMTLPLTVPVFALLPVGAPLCNLLIAPLISVLLGAGIIVVVLSCPLPGGLASFLLGLLCGLADLVCRAVEALATIPGMSLPASCPVLVATLVCLTIVVGLWIVWPMPDRRTFRCCVGVLIAIACGSFIISHHSYPPQIIMLDVGQGDAILLRDGTRCILIDTGPADEALLSALARHSVNHLDAVIITHLHDDHYGALDALKGSVQVDAVIFSAATFEDGYGDSEAVRLATELVGADGIVELHVGDVLEAGGFALRVLSPESLDDEGGNQDSLVLMMGYDFDSDDTYEVTGLFTGDAEHEVLERLEGETLDDIDVLKVGHHGSTASLTQSDMLLLQPEIALIDVGYDNAYGHPSEQTLATLEYGGARVYRTDEDGDITVRFTRDDLLVSCDKIS